MFPILNFAVPIILSSFALVAGENSASECDPGSRTFDRSVAEAQSIFIGRVTKVDVKTRKESGDRFKATRSTFKVLRIWKGGSHKQTLHVWSIAGGEGYDFKVGRDYIVFATSAGQSDELWTSICTRTRPVGEAAVDVKSLDGRL